MHEALSILLQFSRQHVVLMILHSASVAIVPIRDIALPLMYSNVIKAVQQNEDIIKPLVYVKCTLVLVELLDMFAEYCDSELEPKMRSWVRHKIIASIFNGDDVSDVHTGDLNTLLVKLPVAMTSVFERVSGYIAPYVLLHACVIGYFWYVDYALGAMTLAAVCAVYTMLISSLSGCKYACGLRDKAFTRMHEEIDDTVRNLYSVFGCNMRKYEISRLTDFEKEHHRWHKQSSRCVMFWRMLIYPVVIVFLVAFMHRMQFQLGRNMLDITAMVTIFFVLVCLLNSFMGLDGSIKNLASEWGTIDVGLQSVETMRLSRKMYQAPQAAHPSAKTDVDVRFENVTFKYDQTPVLENVTFNIQRGDVVVLLGDVGSGKSTITKLIMKYAEPNEGRVYLNGTDIADMQNDDVRRCVGLVPQMPILFNRSVYENVSYGNNASEDTVRAMFKEIDIDGDINLEDSAGKNGTMLSGGQRQLVWLLRIILADPDILCMDEPTSAMDTQTKHTMLNVIQRYFVQRKKTVIMITHDRELVHMATKILVVKDRSVHVRHNTY